MPETRRGYVLNLPGELPNWSKREYNLHLKLIEKGPDADKTYVSTQHTHAKLVSPDESHNPLVQTTNDGRVGIGTSVPSGPLHITTSTDLVRLKTPLSATLLLDTDYTATNDACDTGIQFLRGDGSAFVSLGLYRQEATAYYLLYDAYACNVIYQVTGLGGQGQFQFNPDKVNRDITVSGTTNDMLLIDVSEERMVMRNCAYLQFCSDGNDDELTTTGAKIWMHSNDDDLYIYNYEDGSVRLRSYSGLYIYHANTGATLTLDVTTAGVGNPAIFFYDGSNAAADSAWTLGMWTGYGNVFALSAGDGVSADPKFIWTLSGRYGLNEWSPASAIDIDDDAGGTDMGHITLEEINDTDNVVPAANHVAIFARDNGGKTELCAKFNSGNIEQLAIET